MKKAIVVGASSGIGRSLAKTLSRAGYVVGLMARRLNLLLELQQEIGQKTYIKQIDISSASDAFTSFSEFIDEMDGVDLIVITAGTGSLNPDLIWKLEQDTIMVNVNGFAAIANVAMHHFISQGGGHLVNISSISALRGNGIAPAYNASKAFESNYLEGLRHKVSKLKLPITITDIQPGFVKTAMAQGEGIFWAASPEKAAQQIYQAILAKRSHAYITKRWRIIAWILKLLPDFVYQKT